MAGKNFPGNGRHAHEKGDVDIGDHAADDDDEELDDLDEDDEEEEDEDKEEEELIYDKDE